MISHGNFNGFTPCFFYSVSALSNTITLWISSTILQTLSNLIHNHLSSQMYISDINYGFELMPNHWLTHKQPISDQKGKQLQPVALRPPPTWQQCHHVRMTQGNLENHTGCLGLTKVSCIISHHQDHPIQTWSVILKGLWLLWPDPQKIIYPGH